MLTPNGSQGRPRGRGPLQRFRLGLLFAVLLLFPLTFNYYSPVLPIHGALAGVACFSLLFWATWFVAALLLGRAGCGYFCPLGALQEIFDLLLQRPSRRSRVLRVVGYLLRFALVMVWIVAIVAAISKGGGIRTVDPLFATENVVSWDSLHGAVIYGGIFGLVLLVWIPLGRRGFCRVLCFWAPLNMIGGWLGRRLRLPTLRLLTKRQACTSCGACSSGCPQALPVAELVQRSALTEEPECILCGRCVDGCRRGAIVYSFGSRAAAPQRQGSGSSQKATRSCRG